MKYIFSTALFLFAAFTLIYAKPVDENTAKTVGQNFFVGTPGSSAQRTSSGLELIYKGASKMSMASARVETTTFFYVFGVSAAKGFVIISGDDNVTPILGYSNEDNFDPANIPQNVAKWLEGYKSQIRYVIENNVQGGHEVLDEWSRLKKGILQNGAGTRTTSVNPLLQTKWNQVPYYNALCPGGSVTGCVATAMAQIMKFWNYPLNGAGFHSYNHAKYGTVSANFGSTTYQWNSMPNTITSTNNAIATLMYHCGVSVDMNYSPESSGAYVIASDRPVCAENAFKNFFGYKNTLRGLRRANYNQAQWVALLKTEFDAKRPVLYAGFGNGGGHCFVADGYDNNDFIHFNWGWGGSFDGYFFINALDPGGVGTGGGTGGFNSGHQAVIGIEPPGNNNGNTGPQTFTMSLYNYVTPSSGTISYGQAFNISTNIVNKGTNAFAGDYCAAIFDNSLVFVDYVEIKTGYTLQGGYAYTNNLTFSSPQILGMLPGKYFVGIFYRPTGGDWYQVANNGAYANLVPLNVSNAKGVELNSAITVTPGTLTKGQPASVNLNVVNKGNSAFLGQYAVGLYKLDGSFVQNFEPYQENNGLPGGYTYLQPYLTMNTAEITAPPGTYLLAALYKPNNTTDWQVTGSTYFQNPIKVTVQLPSLQADRYENNNSVQQSYGLPLIITNSAGSIGTNGANCHVASDYDYYKIILPAGSNYTIKSRIHDSYNSGNGNVYSLDGLISYSTDGINWSDAFDDILPDINVKGGGTVYFYISPYFTGETGTYLLDINVTKTVVTGIDEPELLKVIKTYPNPASEFVRVDLQNFTGKVNLVSIFNSQGQLMYSQVPNQGQTMLTVPVTNLGEALYFLKLESSKGSLTRKIVVRR